VFAVDEVADAPDRLPEDHAGRRRIERDADGPFVPERVQEPAEHAAKQAAIQRDATLSNAGDDLQGLVAEAVPVFEHVEQPRPNNCRWHAHQRNLLRDFRRDAVLFRQPNAERHAADDAQRCE
jgi:hypothetical protein